MLSSYLVIIALITTVVAQSTVSLLLPIVDGTSLVGSIITSDASATTYSITCAATATSAAATSTDSSSSSDSDDDSNDGDDVSDDVDSDFDSDACVLPSSFTLTAGPTTINYLLSSAGLYTYSLACKLQGYTSALCYNSEVVALETGTGMVASTTIVVSSTVVTGDELRSAFVGVVVTAGYGVGSGVVTATAMATATSSVVGAGATATAVVSSASVGSAVSTGVKASDTSSAGAMQVTGIPRWVVGGAAIGMLAVAV